MGLMKMISSVGRPSRSAASGYRDRHVESHAGFKGFHPGRRNVLHLYEAGLGAMRTIAGAPFPKEER